MPPLKACSVTDYGNLFNHASRERTLDSQRADVWRHGLCALLQSAADLRRNAGVNV
jgi:hypothetical protein